MIYVQSLGALVHYHRNYPAICAVNRILGDTSVRAMTIAYDLIDSLGGNYADADGVIFHLVSLGLIEHDIAEGPTYLRARETRAIGNMLENAVNVTTAKYLAWMVEKDIRYCAAASDDVEILVTRVLISDYLEHGRDCEVADTINFPVGAVPEDLNDTVFIARHRDLLGN